jgi:hypothetical protein
MFYLNVHFVLLTVGGLAALESATRTEERGRCIGEKLRWMSVNRMLGYMVLRDLDVLDMQGKEQQDGWNCSVLALAQ